MAVTYRLCKQAVPYKTRLTGRLMLLRESVFERTGLPVRVKKTRLTKNEGFGASTPDPSPFYHTRSDAIFVSNAVSACGAVTFGEWLASISK
jgi:hypothetical protein